MKQVAVPNYKIYVFNLKYLLCYKNSLVLNDEATALWVMCVALIFFCQENNNGWEKMYYFLIRLSFLGEAHETMSWEHRERILSFAVL